MLAFRMCFDFVYFIENCKQYNKINFKCMNNTVRSSFKVFFNKILVGLVNSARNPLKKQKNAILYLHGTHSARSKKKKNPKSKRCLYH